MLVLSCSWGAGSKAGAPGAVMVFSCSWGTGGRAGVRGAVLLCCMGRPLSLLLHASADVCAPAAALPDAAACARPPAAPLTDAVAGVRSPAPVRASAAALGACAPSAAPPVMLAGARTGVAAPLPLTLPLCCSALERPPRGIFTIKPPGVPGWDAPESSCWLHPFWKR